MSLWIRSHFLQFFVGRIEICPYRSQHRAHLRVFVVVEVQLRDVDVAIDLQTTEISRYMIKDVTYRLELLTIQILLREDVLDGRQGRLEVALVRELPVHPLAAGQRLLAGRLQASRVNKPLDDTRAVDVPLAALVRAAAVQETLEGGCAKLSLHDNLKPCQKSVLSTLFCRLRKKKS